MTSLLLAGTTRPHPITGLAIDFNTCCNQCVHFTDKTRTANKIKVRTTRCALDPEARNLADDRRTAWSAMPGCSRHERRPC